MPKKKRGNMKYMCLLIFAKGNTKKIKKKSMQLETYKGCDRWSKGIEEGTTLLLTSLFVLLESCEYSTYSKNKTKPTKMSPKSQK